MSLEDLRRKLLSDPEIKAHYDELQNEFDIARELIAMRNELGLTQRDLAEKAGIKQPQLARIESGKQSPRLDTLKTIASKAGYSVEIRLVPNKRQDQKPKNSNLRNRKSSLASEKPVEPVI
jgi:transcriptional regulator with XRE-family HTH domain